MSTTTDCHAEVRKAFTVGYHMGQELAAGRIEELTTELELTQMDADDWYFIAKNPGIVAEERAELVELITRKERKAQREAERARLDTEEHVKIEEALQLMDGGADDLEIARSCGLFLPHVAYLRSQR